MTDQQLPAAGWYPAAHAGGETRYWDGTQWREPAAAAPQASPRSSIWKRTTSLRTSAIAVGSALTVGLFLGGGAAGSASSAELGQLHSLVSTLETENTAAVDTAAEMDEDVTQARADLDRARDELTDATASLSALHDTATQTQAELDARAARITELETQLAAQPAPAAPAAPAAPVAPVTASYANCDAVRAAGADPIRAGDPGYGRHLDRDGDGVGCE